MAQSEQRCPGCVELEESRAWNRRQADVISRLQDIIAIIWKPYV